MCKAQGLISFNQAISSLIQHAVFLTVTRYKLSLSFIIFVRLKQKPINCHRDPSTPNEPNRINWMDGINHGEAEKFFLPRSSSYLFVRIRFLHRRCINVNAREGMNNDGSRPHFTASLERMIPWQHY